MKQNVTESDFVDGFDRVGRSENFSRQGRRALYEYLTELEESCGEELEYDPVAVCCDYSEYAGAVEAAEDFGWKGRDPDDEDAANRPGASRQRIIRPGISRQAGKIHAAGGSPRPGAQAPARWAPLGNDPHRLHA